MTYQRIYLSKSTVPDEAPQKAPLSQPVSREEKASCQRKAKRGFFRIPLTRLVGAAVICSLSFAAGYSLTDEKSARLMEKISLVLSGRTEQAAEGYPEAQPVTFYEKYMNGDRTTGEEPKIEYISLPQAAQNTEEPKPLPVKDVVAVSSDGKSGAVGGDGEVLYAVMASDMSTDSVFDINNETAFRPDTQSLASKTPDALVGLEIKQGEPLVLILHTHGTECYNSYGSREYMSDSTPSRSVDINENVVCVGRRVAEILNGYGIETIHSEKMCDKDSFVHAYSTSYEEAEYYLEKYPSIRFVIDIHRDAIELADGTRKKPVYESFGDENAQLMLVVGTNEAGANHPRWEENLSLALVLQNEISKDYPLLFRRINLRSASFNQQLSTGYMLLECGSAANTLKEAENAAEIFATGLARVITDYAVR